MKAPQIMASKNSTRFAVLFLILASITGFAQNATLNCSTLTASGDDGSGSITLYTGQPLGCCMVMLPVAGTSPSNYLSASCDGPIYTLQHALSVTSISLDARKNFVAFAPFETLVITTPAGQIRRFPMLWNAQANEGTFTREWYVNLSLPAGTTFYIDAYFSTNQALSCGGIGCLASTVWTLQGSL